jgi:hypothetical protein
VADLTAHSGKRSLADKTSTAKSEYRCGSIWLARSTPTNDTFEARLVVGPRRTGYGRCRLRPLGVFSRHLLISPVKRQAIRLCNGRGLVITTRSPRSSSKLGVFGSSSRSQSVTRTSNVVVPKV